MLATKLLIVGIPYKAKFLIKASKCNAGRKAAHCQAAVGKASARLPPWANLVLRNFLGISTSSLSSSGKLVFAFFFAIFPIYLDLVSRNLLIAVNCYLLINIKRNTFCLNGKKLQLIPNLIEAERGGEPKVVGECILVPRRN